MPPQQDWWKDAPVVSDPGFTGFIPGTPKVKEPKAPVFVPQGATQMFDPNTNTYKPVPQPAQDEKDQLKSAIEGLGVDELLNSLGRARTNLRSGWATGTYGWLAEMKPGGGTARDNFLGQLTSIQGGIINEKLAALKELSKTGASGLGALSEKEGERLASSVAALTPNMSADEYEQSFRQIARHALTLRAIRDGKDPRNAPVAREIEQQAIELTRLQEPQQQKDQAPAVGPAAPGGPGGPGGTPRADYSDLTGGPNQGLATGGYRLDYDESVASGLRSLIRSKRPYAEATAYAESKGFLPPSLAEYNAAVEFQRDHPKARPNVEATRKVPVTGWQRFASSPAGSFGAGMATGATAGFDDEISGALSFLGGGSYTQGRDSYNARKQILAETNPKASLAGNIVGGVSSLGVAGSALKGTSLARAATDKLGRAGASVTGNAGYGALYGFGENNENRLAGAAVGAVGGAAGGALGEYVVGPVAGRVVDRLRGQGGRGMAPDVARAAEAEGVDLIRPMVDPKSISKYGALESNVYSQPIIRGAAARVRGQIEDRALALGEGGAALETGAAGGVMQDAGRRFIQRTKGVADTLYSRARKLGGDARFVPEKAIGQVDSEIAALSANAETNAGEISFLEGLKRDLAAPGGKTIEELRQLRTSLRGRINEQSLGATQAEARAIRAMDATQDDVAANVPAAASAYRRADSYYRERQTHIDDVISRITGGKVGQTDFQVSGEQAFARLKSMASPGGDGRRLAALMRDLDKNERQDIAATIAQGLGREAEDAPFSAKRFLTQTGKLSPSARRTIFGPDGAQSINNLRLLARKLDEAGADINRSRSATVIERQGWRNVARAVIGGLAGMSGTYAGGVGGGVAGLGVAATAMGASAGRRVLSARALVNPRVSLWLARAADISSEAQAREATRKLGVIIGREQAVAGELKPIYDFLQQRLTGQLAAEPKPEGGDNEQ